MVGMAARLPIATRLTKELRRRQARAFSSKHGDRAWRNETPKGSSTEVFVYSPESQISWPDPRLGVVGQQGDPSFSLPGNIGPGALPTLGVVPPPRQQPDVLSRPTNKENQVAVLYNAHDFIAYTPGSEGWVCASPQLIKSFPSVPSLEEMEVVAHEAPLLLRNQLKELFPSGLGPVTEAALTVVTLAVKTQEDMSMWSHSMEEERDKLTEHSVILAKEFCGRLKEEGYWADFIDPCSGTPHYSPHTNASMFETDERYRLLGFRIEDLGCCKVIAHNRFGRNVLVTTLVTNASAKGDVMENIITDLSV